MKCGAVNKKLSAYLDGELSAAEMAEVEEHIKACSACGRDFEELKMTSARIRGLEEVEPPAWLQQRIMTKVREETEQERGILRKLFLPLRVKVPLQTAAALAVCVIAFLVYRAVEPDMKQPRPLQKEALISGQTDEETPAEEYERTEDIPESGSGVYPEIKAGSAQLFSTRRASESFQAEIVKYSSPSANDTFIEVLFRRPDTGELFCGAFPSTHPLHQFVSRFQENARREEATLPELKITAGPPYRGECLLYGISRKVTGWENLEKIKPRNTNSK